MSTQYIEDLIRLLDLEAQTDIGSEGFIFGNYLEFPAASEIDSELLCEVLEILGVPLPFKGEATASSFTWLPDLSPAIRALVLEVLGKPEVSAMESGDFLLRFPDLNASPERIIEIVEGLLPQTLYENDLPDSLRYWQPDPEDSNCDPNDELLSRFRSQPVTLNTLTAELRSLQETLDATQEPVVKKAIALAGFSLVESFARQRALLKAPDFPGLPKFDDYLKTLLSREVEKEDRRKRLVNALEPGKEWKQQIPSWKLRNALAHDIGGVSAERKEFTYAVDSRKSEKREKITEKNLFEELLGYAEENLG